jgi:hypothetical protein
MAWCLSDIAQATTADRKSRTGISLLREHLKRNQIEIPSA